MAIALISPLGTALALGLLALALALWRWRRLSWLLAAIALLWLWVWSTPAASLWLRAGLESRYPPLALQAVPSAQAIVVLGGALSLPSAGRRLQRQTCRSRERAC